MASKFMDRFRFNTENAPDVFYIQNLKKKPTKTFHEYANRWRSEAAKVQPALEEEHMNKFFVRAQDLQYYERLMLIENYKFSDIIKLGEKIEEGIKSGMVTNLEALQARNKALQSGGTSKKTDLYERLKAAGYVTPIPAITLENPSQWVKPNKTCAYHSGMKGHTIDECRSLKDKIQTLIDNKIIVAKKPAPNVHNNPLPDHKGGGVHMIEIEDDWDPKGSIGLIVEGDDHKKPTVTLNPIVVQIQPSKVAEVNRSIPLEFQAPSSAKMPVPIEVKFGSPKAPVPFEVAVLPSKARVPIPVAMTTITSFHTKAIPWDYTSKARRKRKAKSGEAVVAQGSNLNICPLVTLRTLGKSLHEIKYGAINVKAFDGSQRSTIGEISLCLQIGPTWFDVDFQVIDVPSSYNLLLGRPWIHADGAVVSTLHQVVKFEWNHQEVIIHGDGSNPIYSRQTIPAIGVRRKIGGETYHHIERVNAIDKDKWWDNKIESILNWCEYELGKGLGKNLQGIAKPIKLKKHENVKETRISVHLSPSENEEYTEFLKEYEDIFAWSYDDMTGLSTSIVAHKLLTDPTCPPLNPAKCAFGFPTGKLLGFIVSRQGIELDPSKIKAIQEFPPPKNEKDVMIFLGRLNYISQFIAQSTVICEPIFKMLKKDAATKWTDDCQKAFDRIKEYLSTPLV
ncbi:uncharacterized protein [Nicotiana sylvestris]|uniref:uncharacterized protein n=1 Tax=Nicotiana sylvestris TaxID=4096 RepID=UPI00388C3772